MQSTYSKTTVDLGDGRRMVIRPGNGAIYVHDAEKNFCLAAFSNCFAYERAQEIIEDWESDGPRKAEILSRFKPYSEALQRLPF